MRGPLFMILFGGAFASGQIPYFNFADVVAMLSGIANSTQNFLHNIGSLQNLIAVMMNFVNQLMGS